MEANILQQSDDVTVLCSSSDCASIMISGCTFINFNYLKSTFLHFQYLIDKTSVMKYQGLILSMSSFPGEILINRNTFENLRFKYSSCHISHNTNQTTSLSSLWNADVHQVKTLIRIETHSNVLIQGNTFTGCNSHSGLLHIERTHNQHPIIVKDNIFTRNSALSVANLIRIDLATDYDYSHPIPDHMPCSSILISGNTFSQNIGCSSTVSVLKSQCYTTTDLAAMKIAQAMYTPPTAIDFYAITEPAEIYNFSTENITNLSNWNISMDMNKFLVTGNTYDGNFAGLNSGIVYFLNLRRFVMVNETFTNNDGHYREALVAYGAIPPRTDGTIEDSGAIPFDVYYNPYVYLGGISESISYLYYPGSPIVIDSLIDARLQQLTFVNNFKQEEELILINGMVEPSQGISVRR